MSHAHEFLGALRSAMETEETEEPVLPMREAQVDYLRTFVASVGHPVAFKRGDFVRYREGAGPVKKDLRQQLALMYWRGLDTAANPEDHWRLDQADDAERKMLPRIDCLIAVFLPQGLTFWLSCRELLERADP